MADAGKAEGSLVAIIADEVRRPCVAAAVAVSRRQHSPA